MNGFFRTDTNTFSTMLTLALDNHSLITLKTYGIMGTGFLTFSATNAGLLINFIFITGCIMAGNNHQYNYCTEDYQFCIFSLHDIT